MIGDSNKHSSSDNNTPPHQGEESIPERLARISKDRNRLLAEEGVLIEKGLSSYDPDTLIKAQQHWNDVQQRESSNAKSTLIDPNEFNDSLGYKAKRNSLTFGMLRRMAMTPVIRAVITTRQAQVSAFASPQRSRFDTGFVVRKKGELYDTETKQPTTAELKEARMITKFLLNCGDERRKWHADNFDKFLKKLVADSLELDQGTFEIVRNLMGIPVEFFATDAATMRVASSYDDDEFQDRDIEEKFGYKPSYVQIIDGEPSAEYYPWELCFGIRNDSTNIARNGYGRSELEDLVNVVTWMLNGDDYNGKFFSQGAAPRGLIKVAGNVNQGRLQEFKQQWLAMISGVQNAWKVPVIESDKMEFIDLQKSNTDMQFGKWQEYLIKVACAVYKIAPEEAGFSLGNASGGGAMFESNNEARIKYSRDKGLKPLLKSIEFWINKYIVEAINDDFEFAFVGMDTDSKKDELDLDIKMVQNFGGYKEARTKWGLKAELEEGDFPLNQIYMQHLQQEQMAGMMEDNTEFVEDDVDLDEEEWDNLDKAEISSNPMENDLASWFKEEFS